VTPADPLYNEFEAATYLGLSVHTLRNQRHRGVGCPYLKVGPAVRYSLKLMDAYLKSCIRTSTRAA